MIIPSLLYHTNLHAEAFFAQAREPNVRFGSAIQICGSGTNLPIEKSVHQHDFSIYSPHGIFQTFCQAIYLTTLEQYTGRKRVCQAFFLTNS